MPGTTRRCVVPLGKLRPAEPVELVAELSSGQACLLQMNCLTLY